MTKKVKRTISLIIAAIMLLSTMSVLALAADCPKTYAEATSKEIGPHDHVAAVDQFGAVIKTEDTAKYAQPTCVKPGCKEFFVKCAICGQEMPGTREKVYLPILASHHQAGPVCIEDIVEPTCAADGSYYEVVRCVLCNAVLSRTLVAVKKTTAHVPGAPRKENIVNATCAKVGSYDSVIYCKVCGRELQRTFKEIPKLTYHVSEYSLDRIVTNLGNGKVSVQFLTRDQNGKPVYPVVDGPVAGLRTDANGDIFIVTARDGLVRAVRIPELLTKSDSGVANGFFAAGRFAANGGTTRTCADGEERCAICGELLNPEIPHVWDKGTVTRAASLTAQGEITYLCLIKGCGARKTVNTPRRANSLGDVDADGAVTTADARFILRYAVGLGDFDKVISACCTDYSFKAADYDKNGKIEPADARMTLRAAVGLRN